MVKILFDPQGANALNKLIQSKVAPHLFIVCNYHPDVFSMFSDDARFILGVLNLYKFSIDTSLINRLGQIDKKLGGNVRRKYRNSLSELEKCLETVSYLRTFAAHNNDHNDKIDKTEAWLIHIIHKKQFETIEDYSEALKELNRLGERIYNTVTEILNHMCKEYSKGELCEIFQDYILNFYSVMEENTNTSLFKEELRAAYRARSQTRGVIQDRSLGLWCKNKYLKALEDRQDILSSCVPRLKGDQKRQVVESINQIKDEIDKIERQVANNSNRCKGDVAKLSVLDFLDFYRRDSVDNCTKVLPNILKEKLTMLPQDMFQYIIMNDFGSVPLDEA